MNYCGQGFIPVPNAFMRNVGEFDINTGGLDFIYAALIYSPTSWALNNAGHSDQHAKNSPCRGQRDEPRYAVAALDSQRLRGRSRGRWKGGRRYGGKRGA